MNASPTGRTLFPESWDVKIPPAPSREASVGELINRTMGTIKARFVDVTRIVAITAGSAFVVQALTALLAPDTEPGVFSGSGMLISIVGGVCGGVLMVWLQTSLTLLAGAERLGAPMSLRTALREGLEAVPAGIWTRAVQAVVMIIAFICLIVPAIIFAVRFCVGMQISTFERRSGLDALRASNELVRDRAWDTFTRLFGFWLVQIAAAVAFGIAAVVFLLGAAILVKSATITAVLAVIVYLFAAGFAVAFYSIWRTEFYIALVAEQGALAAPES